MFKTYTIEQRGVLWSVSLESGKILFTTTERKNCIKWLSSSGEHPFKVVLKSKIVLKRAK